jgi:hypothetical protein
LTFSGTGSTRHAFAALLLLYGLGYPAIVALTGHSFPRAPGFGVPCPVTLFTAGVLFAAHPPVPRTLITVPVLWSLVGGSAALLFEMAPDVMLFVAGAALAWDSLARQHQEAHA